MKTLNLIVISALTLTTSAFAKDKKCEASRLIKKIGKEAVRIIDDYDSHGLDKLEIKRFKKAVENIDPLVSLDTVKSSDGREVSAKNRPSRTFFNFADWERYTRDPKLAVKLVAHEYLGKAIVDDSGYIKSEEIANIVMKERGDSKAIRNLKECASKKTTKRKEGYRSDFSKSERTTDEIRELQKFYQAIWQNNVEKVKGFLADGISVHETQFEDMYETPLHYAVEKAFEPYSGTQMAEFLLSRGANPDAYDFRGDTPPLRAIMYAQRNIGKTDRRTDQVMVLFNDLLDIFEKYETNFTLPSKELVSMGYYMGDSTNMLIEIASFADYVDISKLTDRVLGYGFDVNHQKIDGTTALMQTFNYTKKPENIKVYFDKVLAHQKDINLELTNKWTGTALMQAVRAYPKGRKKPKGSRYYIDELLTHGAKVCTEFDGKTVLNIAKEAKEWSLLKLLRKQSLKNGEKCYKKRYYKKKKKKKKVKSKEDACMEMCVGK